MTDNALLAVDDLTVSYSRERSHRHPPAGPDAANVLHKFSAKFDRRKIHWILGPNGAGKSTLFRAIAGELTPTSGQILFDGACLADTSPTLRVRRGIGRFLQSDWVFPNLSLLDNLLVAAPDQLGEHPFRWLLPAARRREKQTIDHALTRLDEFGFTKLFDVRTTKAGVLSCGWAKLLSLVRLLVQDSKLWLLDEPVANVDEANQDRICDLIRREAKDHGKTIVIIEHEVGRQGRVSGLADHALLLFQGRIVNEGEPLAVKMSQVYRDVFGAA
jgi:branched-chain amino acid transport system ATP-binding protein